MKRRLRHGADGLFVAVACFVAAGAAAGDIEYLKRNERFCDTAEVLCLRGTISYRVNERLFEISARVETAAPPGTLRIGFSGENRQGRRRATSIEVALAGRHSEIVSKRMIPDAPDVYSWTVDSIIYVPD
ncbi:MAG: hypothetical protein OEW35_10570 [Gammaproteobacteria bacterium]|nr:hypothetical protein [Gammaproteobacteria bacterium]MDH4255077.1 hypothetical protein [Gammaproteobacteria bacterium]MDH5309571.1 hypothetical protein [Gammaproteobacteria bacterium]